MFELKSIFDWFSKKEEPQKDNEPFARKLLFTSAKTTIKPCSVEESLFLEARMTMSEKLFNEAFEVIEGYVTFLVPFTGVNTHQPSLEIGYSICGRRYIRIDVEENISFEGTLFFVSGSGMPNDTYRNGRAREELVRAIAGEKVFYSYRGSASGRGFFNQ